MITAAIVVGGLSSVAVKFVIESMPVFMAAGLRWIGAGAIFLAFGYAGMRHLRKKDAKNLAIQALLQTVVGLSWFAGLSYAQAINASIIFLMSPVFVYLGSVLILKEPRSNRALAGSLLSLSGGLLMFGAPVLSGDSTNELIGMALLTITSVGWAAMVIHSKQVINDKNIFAVLSLRYFAVGLLAFGISLGVEDARELASVTAESWVWLIFLIIIAGALVNYVIYKGLEYVRAEDTASLFYLDQLVGAVGGAVLLSETLSGPALLAAGVIVAGVIVAHPVHMTRTIFYRTPHHSRLDDFLDWMRQGYKSINKFVHRFF